MDMVNVLMLMGKNISDFINMIKNADLVFLKKKKKNIMSDFGMTGNKMDWENLLKMIILNMVFGKMEKKKNGLMTKKNFLINLINLTKNINRFLIGMLIILINFLILI